MLLIYLSLIGLIAIGAFAALTPVTQFPVEFVPVPVRIDEAEILSKKF